MADHKLREDVENMKNILFDIREWRRTFDAEGAAGGSADDDTKASIAALRQELATVKACMMGERNVSQDVHLNPSPRLPGSQNSMSVVNVEVKPSLHKRGAAQGMTQDQVQDFKKQQLLVNALQDRIKELESKMVAAQARIILEGQRIEDLAEREEQKGNEFSQTIDKIDYTLSEKIAEQRKEMMKLAHDVPEPINYDPFNYGEAYKGDIVDFEARKRCFELKLLLQGLQTNLRYLKDSITVSNSIDLGYEVVRMDQLLHATGFGQRSKLNEAGNEVMVIEQNKTRQPGLQMYPKQEMFQTDEAHKSNWSITNTIMQTMYRLETELAALQKTNGLADVTNTHKTLREIQTELNSLKKQKMEEKDVQKILSKIKHGVDSSVSVERNPRILNTEGFVSKETFTKVVHSLNNSVDKLLKHFKDLDSSSQSPTTSAAMKQKCTNVRNKAKVSCLSCNGAIAGSAKQGVNTNIPVMPKLSPKANHDRIKYQYMFNRAFTIGINGINEDFSVPGTYESSALLYKHMNLHKNLLPESPKKGQNKHDKCPHYIRGCDGKLYFADKKITETNEKKETNNNKTNDIQNDDKE